MFGLGFLEMVPLLLFLALLAVPVLYFREWSATLRLTRAHHGASPGLVWLLFIPVFNLGWQFYLLSQTTKGIKGRFRELGKSPGDAGFGVGLAYQVLLCLAAATNLGHREGSADPAGVLLGLFVLAALVTLVIYWVRLARFNRVMRAASAAATQQATPSSSAPPRAP